MKYIYLLFAMFLLAFSGIHAQNDSVKVVDLKAVHVKSKSVASPLVKSLPTIYGTSITSGRRNAVIQVADMPINYAQKNAQQVFAKVPGAMVYDMDGAGNQINIALRGLDPHRSWEMNVRHDGVLTNSDMYGYPASHYSMPLEAIDRVEIISGTAALGYGAQFGGLVNYVTKSPDTTRRISFQNIATAGSYGLLSNYTAVGGKSGALTYQGYYHRRKVEGFRQYAQSSSEAFLIKTGLEIGRKFRAEASLGRSTYLYRMPGPLTDDMFTADPRQATRSRNWYSPDIYLPALKLEWQLNEQTRLSWLSSAILGTRNSVMIIGFANVPDVIDPATNDFKNRQVDIDRFESYTHELRLRHDYTLAGKMKSTFVGGVQIMDNDLHRRQLGKGTTAGDYDLTVLDDNWGRDMHFRTNNLAVFAENLIYLLPKLSVTFGARYESGASERSGFIRYLNPEQVPLELQRNFVLAGASAQYQFQSGNRLFGGYAESYRPFIFADVIPANALERTDPDLQDATGYNAEIGWENYAVPGLRYSVTLFQLRYNNRIGSVYQTDQQGNGYLLKTNIGNSVTRGAELYAEIQRSLGNHGLWSVFSSTAFMKGQYLSGILNLNNENVDISGNVLETTPEWTSRNGLRLGYKNFTALVQYSVVSGHFSDAYNTVAPSANGARGWVPGYQLWDVNASLRISPQVKIMGGVNNLLNTIYFTKRPAGYPGPGIWSSDGRNYFVTLETTF